MVAPVLLLLIATASARADAEVYRQALRSTGWVVVPGPKTTASGTCWLADRERRLVVTCRHVVGASKEVLIYFPSFEENRPIVEAAHYLKGIPAVSGHVVATDTARDLALIRVAAVPDGVEEMPLADRPCGPGDDVHCLGNSGLRGNLAKGTLWWYTRGSVRQVHRGTVTTPGGSRQVCSSKRRRPSTRATAAARSSTVGAGSSA